MKHAPLPLELLKGQAKPVRYVKVAHNEKATPTADFFPLSFSFVETRQMRLRDNVTLHCVLDCRLRGTAGKIECRVKCVELEEVPML